MPSDDNAAVERRATYMTLTGMFMSAFTAFLMRERRSRRELDLRPFDLALLGTATYRLGRLAAYDKVTEPWRRPFTETRTDSSGAGETVVPKGNGVRRALGELISCPICVGTWIAAGLVYGLQIAPRSTRAFLAIMSSVGVAELLNAATEALSWAGQSEREEVGAFQRSRGSRGG